MIIEFNKNIAEIINYPFKVYSRFLHETYSSYYLNLTTKIYGKAIRKIDNSLMPIRTIDVNIKREFKDITRQRLAIVVPRNSFNYLAGPHVFIYG